MGLGLFRVTVIVSFKKKRFLFRYQGIRFTPQSVSKMQPLTVSAQGLIKAKPTNFGSCSCTFEKSKQVWLQKLVLWPIILQEQQILQDQSIKNSLQLGEKGSGLKGYREAYILEAFFPLWSQDFKSKL